MFSSSIPCMSLLICVMGFSQAVLCPPGFTLITPQQRSHTQDYCFLLTGLTNMSPDHRGLFLCERLGGKMFEILSWTDQRAAELFLKEQRHFDPVWLGGMVGRLAFRKASQSFFWLSEFFPKVKNFLDPNSVPSSLDGCVVMDPMRSFKWAGANCDEALFRALCYKSLPRYMREEQTEKRLRVKNPKVNKGFRLL